MPFDNKGNHILVFPLLPYTAPPTVAATNPSEQNTNARPDANARVGSTVSLSFRSPAAVDMYDIVKGSSPQTQGDTDVNSPAPYMTGIEEIKLDGSSRDTEAKEEAAD